MKVELYSHHFAYDLMHTLNYQKMFEEIMTICKECPTPYYPNKSKKQKGKDVVQPLMNSYIEERLLSMGWISQPKASKEEDDDRLKADFSKNFPDLLYKNEVRSAENGVRAIIEVEFGNNASYYRDLYKFQLAFSKNTADICFLIVPKRKLAERMDSGVINFEKPCRELKDARMNVPIPILVIGLDVDENNIWNLKELIGENLDYVKRNHVASKVLVQSYIEYKNEKIQSPYYVNDIFIEVCESLKKNEKELKKLHKELEKNIEGFDIQLSDEEKVSLELKKQELHRKLSNLELDKEECIKKLNNHCLK
ncbi:BglII/BstYI family type II restriction endonuclease [Erysipelotrichaceae bacterium HCN-30851]